MFSKLAQSSIRAMF
ncbi:hypothetical protein HEN97_010170 [Escherichia coli]|nr:hypothetical protein [Escherichia coli]